MTTGTLLQKSCHMFIAKYECFTTKITFIVRELQTYYFTLKLELFVKNVVKLALLH